MQVLKLLVKENILPRKYREHPLREDYKGCWECHITPEVVLIYEINKNAEEIVLIRFGSEKKVFKKS